jgi:hypothetical protein
MMDDDDDDDDKCETKGGVSGRGNRTRRNLPQCHFVHHKSYWPRLNPGRRSGKVGHQQKVVARTQKEVKQLKITYPNK